MTHLTSSPGSGCLTACGVLQVTTGGVALKYYASQRVDVRKAKAIDGEKDGPARGLRIRAKVTKNKVGAPFGMTQFDILFDRGLDKVGCLVDAAVQVRFQTP